MPMASDQKEIYERLQKRFSLMANEPLKHHTSFKVGGPADLIALPKSKPELEGLLLCAAYMNIPVTIIGSGTNLLIMDKGIRGLVISIKALKSEIKTVKNKQTCSTIRVSAGERLSKVCRYAIENALSGLEFAAGIPGTIGGAVMMNAGTPKGSMSDVVDSIEVLDQITFSFETITKKDLSFSYRNLGNKEIVIVDIYLTLKKADRKTIENVFEQNMDAKKSAQPVSRASAGCF
ncbi:MAG: FAD-binding protein, partial [Desulfobacteraceae bacterium]|nr:FAD-binding protein [Desulfobacteraceae bacterium]